MSWIGVENMFNGYPISNIVYGRKNMDVKYINHNR